MKVNVNCCNLMKVKVNCYNPKSLNDEMNGFFSVEIGKLVTATSIGHWLLSWREQVEEKGQEGQDVLMVFLQLLLLVVITMKLEVAFDPGSGPDYFKVMQNPSLLGGVSVHLFFIFVQL